LRLSTIGNKVLCTETGRKLSIPFRGVNGVIGTSIAQYRGVLYLIVVINLFLKK